uniref:DUF3343 domain-containing protein n=1 Tax=Ascaris lumbricoides TaxID=6252 RepID=A0A0M3I8G8_ASCLU
MGVCSNTGLESLKGKVEALGAHMSALLLEVCRLYLLSQAPPSFSSNVCCPTTPYPPFSEKSLNIGTNRQPLAEPTKCPNSQKLLVFEASELAMFRGALSPILSHYLSQRGFFTLFERPKRNIGGICSDSCYRGTWLRNEAVIAVP